MNDSMLTRNILKTGATEVRRNTREFDSGALRHVDTGKLDYEAFFSPEVLRAFAIYMDFNRQLPDGTERTGDNWQKGIPLDVYIKSGARHFFDWWLAHRDCPVSEGRVWAMLGLMFNTMGYLHEYMKQHPSALPLSLAAAIERRDVEPK